MDIFTTSHLRANIIAWLPVKKTDSVCYIGMDTDVIAGKLREMSDHVICHPAGEMPAREGGYDFIVSAEAACEETLRMYGRHLRETGILILCAENAYGLKYLAGAKEIATGEYFASVEGRREAKGRTKEELSKMAAAAGFAWQKFYYPFPDYYFTMALYSDEHLPGQGELIDPIGNFDAERLMLFDEGKAMDALLAREKFTEFSSSYLIVAGKSQAAQMVNGQGEEILYVKHSNDRGAAHAIRTLITKSLDGRMHLVKMADGDAAAAHVEHLTEMERALRESYADGRFLVNACSRRADGVELEFLSGHTMEEELDLLLEQGEEARAKERMLEVFSAICDCKGVQEFQMTEAFQNVFGNPALPEGLLAANVSDIDLIMSNILIGEDGRWTILDYEWSFAFPIPQRFILYRNIRYYADTTADRRALCPDALYKQAGILSQELLAYAEMEEAFQAYVQGGHAPMRQLYKEAGRPAYHISSILHVVDEMERRSALQVYFDRGRGFCEADSTVYRSKALDGTYQLEIPIASGVQRLRIDPGSQACTVELVQLAWKNRSGSAVDFIHNGHRLTGNLYLFDTDDPNVLVTQVPQGENVLQIDVRIDAMSLKAAEWIAPKIDTKYRLKKLLKK